MTARAAPALIAAAWLAFLPQALAAQDPARPLSSIDWLSDSLDSETLRPMARAQRVAIGGAEVEPVTVTPLDASLADGAGVLSSQEAGLPADLWGPGRTDRIAARVASFPLDALPAARSAFKALLLARLDPPAGGGTPGVLLLSRVDALMAMGALDDAAALIAASGADAPGLFRRYLDIALLQGNEDAACARLRISPGIAPSLPVRIFCLARSGDWPAAALTLETADALGQLTAAEDALLARFLELDAGEGLLPPLARLPAPTPLEWRMLEAIGERQPTSDLPRAFAHADLRETAGWKIRIEATERLVRAGALPPERLLDVYSERSAAASGGVWDRVAAKQKLDTARASGTPDEIARALSDAWARMERAGLGQAFAQLVGTAEALPELSGEAEALRWRILLLGSVDQAAVARAPGYAGSPIARELALGPLAVDPGDAAPSHPVDAALLRAFTLPLPEPPATISALAAEQRTGEALVEALRVVARGREADPRDLAGALGFLVSVGMEREARRAALEIYFGVHPA